MNWTDLALEYGYKGTDEEMTRIGMAIEDGELAWHWYETGNDKFDVAAIFEYRDEAPNRYDTVMAYAEGAANEV